MATGTTSGEDPRQRLHDARSKSRHTDRGKSKGHREQLAAFKAELNGTGSAAVGGSAMPGAIRTIRVCEPSGRSACASSSVNARSTTQP